MSTAVATFASYHSSLDHTRFRIWAKAIADLLIAAGMTQTADTGQIDFTTVTVPSASGWTTTGALLQKTWPTGDSIWLRLVYGSSSGWAPTISIEWSPYGTDGAGNLIRSRHTQVALSGSITGWNSTTNAIEYTSYACVHDETQSINLQVGGTIGFWISFNKRISNVTGLPVPQKDYVILGGVPGASGSMYGTATNAIGTAWWSWRDTPFYYSSAQSTNFCTIPYGMTSSPAGNKLIFPWRVGFPAAHIVKGGVTYITTEVTINTTFQVAIGNDPILRTYRATGLSGGANGTLTPGSVALLWE
jgi:hypothetical protein